MKKIKLIIMTLVLSFLALPVLAQTTDVDLPATQERIISYDSRITVNADASMDVVEKIKVHAQSDQIKHGIYRDFPTQYRDRYGNNYKVGFKVLAVSKDGVIENFWTESQGNGVRVYIGQKDVLLEPGDYTYEISYKTTRQLGFFADHDELYWNVTGNGWVFPIESATAQVVVSGAISDQMRFDAFTGPQGSTDKNFNIDLSGGYPVFSTTKPLEAYEGLTIVVGWPKGIIAEPTAAQKLSYFFWDNAGLLAGLIVTIIVLLYFLAVWSRVGRDPRKGTIIAQYNLDSLSPALAGYINRMGYSDKLFSASIVSCAIKGLLKIGKEDNYKFEKITGDDNKLSKEEKDVISKLFSTSSSIEVDNSHHSKFSSAITAFKNSLKSQGQPKYFSSNTALWLVGLGISAVVLVFASVINSGPAAAGTISIAFLLSIWTAGIYAFVKSTIMAWRSAISEKKTLLFVAAIVTSIFILPFIAGEIFGLAMLGYFSGFGVAIAMIILALIYISFYHLLKAPTILGRQTMDEIEGFKLFLTVTEKDRMNFFNPPEKTPELFEKFLPYALALGVENKWAEQFTEVFRRLHEENNDWSPSWYAGTYSAIALSDFSSSLGSSMGSAISSASVAPGSSSGFGGGGGGGSGGGGGGGGGGGW